MYKNVNPNMRKNPAYAFHSIFWLMRNWNFALSLYTLTQHKYVCEFIDEYYENVYYVYMNVSFHNDAIYMHAQSLWYVGCEIGTVVNIYMFTDL